MKKLALILTLCLAVTMLPGFGYCEDDALEGLIDIQIEGVTGVDVSENREAGVELPAGEAMDDLSIKGELTLDLGEMTGALPDTDELIENVQSVSESPDQVEPASDQAAAETTPHVDPDGPQLAANALTLGVGEKFALNAAMPDDVGGKISFSSSKPKVAKVSADGVVTALKVGFTCVRAEAENGKYSECFVDVKKAPDAVSFNVSSLSIGKGEEYERLKVIVGSEEGAYAGAYTLKSSKTSVVKVTDNRVLKGVRTGKARITVKTYNGKKASLDVTVVKAPDKITLSVDKERLGVGEKGKVSYKLPKDTAGAVTFSSKNPAVVSVDAVTGEIEGMGVGETRIYGKTFNGKKDYVTVSVGAAPAELRFESDAVKLGVGMALKLSASMDEGAAGEVVYRVKDKKIAQYKDGTIEGRQEGKTVLTAKAYNGVRADCAIEVVAPPEKVKLPYKTLDIGVNQSVRLQPDVGDSASTFSYSSSDKKIVKVASDGTITGVKKGKATITVKTYNGKKCKLKVNVVKGPSSVALSPESLELSVGETAELTWTFPKGTAAGVAFESSDPAVATVDPETGVVTGVSAGEAVITVTTTNGKTAQTAVKVLPPVEWVAFTEASVEIGVGQTHALTVEMNPGASSPLKFVSSDKTVATVSKSGVVKGVSAGEASVSVATNVKGVTARTTVKVLPAPDSVQFGTDAVTLNIGDTLLLMPIIPEGTATGFTYSSSDPDIASVSGEGTLTALARGEATIAVVTTNDLRAEIKVTVEDPLFPESAQLTNAPSQMKAGESLQLTWKVKPAGANVDFAWESSNADIAYVDEAGVLYAVDMGYATITATSRSNPEIVLNFQVTVETDNLTLTIPVRITGTGGIGRNLEMIDAIRTSAIGQIDAMKANGMITSSDADKRKRIINNAFKDYAFPWMTLKKQKYWKEKYAEGGDKDFKPDRVYYGVPYTQDGRAYNVDRLLHGNYYYDSGKGYYVLNQDKVEGRKYRGSDCSSFLDAAIWGTDSDHSDDRTSDINKTSVYKTIKGYENLRTGDLICKSHAHVVMFLYFVNAEKTKMMIIENGGIEPGTNTVHCMVMNVSWYKSRDYKIRRLKKLG